MAAVLLRGRLAERGISDVVVSSAGFLAGGAPATADARITVGGLDDHVSRALTPALVDGADVVVVMARHHLREAAVLTPTAFAKTFTLKDLVRRAERHGARRPDEDFVTWLDAVGSGRRPADYLGDHADDDVADPIGRPIAEYERTARELDDLLARFVALAWPRR